METMYIQILTQEMIDLKYECWEKYIKGKSINGLPMHAKRRALWSVPEEVFYIVRAYLARRQFGVN